MRLSLRRFENAIFIIKKTFRFWQALGIHVVPNHYYEPVPDTRKIRETRWSPGFEPVGIDFRDAAQVALLKEFADKYKAEYDKFPFKSTGDSSQYYVDNKRFGPVDGEIDYCMIRRFKPRRIIEIGSGFSTTVSMQALQENIKENAGHRCEFVSVDPYPIKLLRVGVPGVTRSLRAFVQDVPLREFETLEENDILFIDSSHVLKIDSDVHFLFLEVLPRLKPGVIVHVHDIFFPADYPRLWVKKYLRFYTEQYLLQAMLQCGSRYEVLLGCNYMHLKHPELLQKAIGTYDPKGPGAGSFWMRVKK